MTDGATSTEQTHYLNKEEEFRIEVKIGTSVRVTLTDGTAEVFGAELPKGTPVELPGGKHAIFSWHGATIDVSGPTELEYVARDTPMAQYLNLDGVLEERRKAAAAASAAGDAGFAADGPRVALVGPTDVGKSSVAKILTNYAVRKGWAPLFVDLDPGQGGITCPATIGAVPVDRPIDAQEGVPLEMPLVYFHGDASPGNNPDLYRYLVERMATMLDARHASNPAARAAGVVINTMGWVEGQGYKLLLHALDALKVDNVVVVGQERLHSEITRDFRHKRVGGESMAEGTPVRVWKLNKSGGVVERSPEFRRKSRDNKIKEYFYGTPGAELQPHSQTLPFGQVSIFKVGGGPRAPTTALPIGQQSSSDPLRVTTVAPSMSLLNAVLAVSHGKSNADLLSSNVAGFVYVTEVDMQKKQFTYVSPSAGELPSRNLLMGSLTWIETLN